VIDPDEEQTALARRVVASRDAGAVADPGIDTTVIRDAARGGTTVPAPAPPRRSDVAEPAPAASASARGRVASPPSVADATYGAREVPPSGRARREPARSAPQEYVDTAAVEARLRRRRRRRAIAAAVAASAIVVAAAVALAVLLSIG
jgi:hypothetical protein